MTLRSRSRAMVTAQSGAVAIEYALIGAVLGLGIIAALQTTHTSLNGAFSRVSGQIGSVATGQAAVTPTPSPAPIKPTITPFASQFWGSKTLSSYVTGTNNGNPNYTFTYTDGSQAQLVKYTGQTYAYLVAIGDRTNYQIRYEYFDANNNATYVQVNQYDSTMSVLQSVQYSTNSDGSAMAGNPPTGSFVQTQTYDSSGNQTGTLNSVGSIYNTASANADGEGAYFKGMVP